MAENKKSFVLYTDLLHTFKYLNLEQRGLVITWVLEYVNDMNPEPLEGLLQAVAEPIRLQLKRDLNKYEAKKKQWSEAGKRSAEARKVKKESTDSTDVETRSTDLTVNDTVNVTVNDNVSVIKNIDSREAEFKNSLQPFLEAYGSDLLNSFYLYWTEKKPKGRKMLFEMQKTFDIKRRLDRWHKNDLSYKKEKSFAQKEKPKMLTDKMKEEYGIE